MEFILNPITIGIIIGFPLGVYMSKKISIGSNDLYKKVKNIIPYIRFIALDKIDEELKKEGIILDESDKCSVCGRQITFENFGAVNKKGNKKIFVCSNKHCMNIGNIMVQ